MGRIHAQSMCVSLGLVVALAFPATAAASARVNIGTGDTMPAVAVDAAGTAYIAWEDSSGPFLHYCKLPAGAVACTGGQTLTAPQQPNGAGVLGSPSVILEGSDVLIFAYDNGGGSDEGVAGWVSTDGGNTFTNEPPGTTMSYTPPNNDSVTTNPVTALGNGLVAVGYVVPLGSPQMQAAQYDPATATFQAISQSSYIPPSQPPPFATLDPSNTYASAVNGAGNGWVAYSVGSTEYAQPFVKADAMVPPTVSGSGVSNGSSVTVSITCLLATPCTFTITITGTEVTVTQASAARRRTHKRTITIATGRFTVNAKKSTKLAVRLTRAGKALLAKDHGHLRGSILLALKVSGGVKKTTRGISITTRKPHRR